ncbi:MAG: hypothetical protein DSZ05_00730 [Sulfurospirillum sp.]|nr:MAG: hypothetical protein DSZ05_00730 [Sulfurospirillum sp.]
MKNYLIFGYALIGYLASLVTLTYLILWVYPWDFMKYSVDTPVIPLDLNPFAVDIALLLFFGLQHSLMARTFFKDGLLNALPEAVKAATYALASSLCLVLIFLFWQPVGSGVVWEFHDGVMFWLLTFLYIAGWVIAFIATFIIDHFELFGLHQGYRLLKNLPDPEPVFQVKLFYRYVRHPIQAGTMVGLFATPVMSYTHLLFSAGMGLYILIGLKFEEKSLLRLFGERYRAYMRTTPMLFPFRVFLRR